MTNVTLHGVVLKKFEYPPCGLTICKLQARMRHNRHRHPAPHVSAANVNLNGAGPAPH